MEVVSTAAALRKSRDLRERPEHFQTPGQIAAASETLVLALRHEINPVKNVRVVFELLYEMANPIYASRDEHLDFLVWLVRNASVSWQVRDYAADLLASCGSQWGSGLDELLGLIDDEDTPWGYRLVLTGCCGQQGAQRLVALLERTRFDETRLRVKVQNTILQLADEVDVTQLLDTLYDGLRWDARAAMIQELPARPNLMRWVGEQLDGSPVALRAAAILWFIDNWRGDPPEVEPHVALAVADREFDYEMRTLAAHALGRLGTRTSLEALSAGLSSSSRALNHASGSAIRAIDERYPVAPGVEGALSVALEEQIQGALSQTADAGKGDLTDAASSGEHEMVPFEPEFGTLERVDRATAVAKRWDRLGVGPRKLPLPVWLRLFFNGSNWMWPIWGGLCALNLLILVSGVAASNPGSTLIGLGLVSSFYIQGPLFLTLFVLALVSKDVGTLRRGRPLIANEMSRIGKTSQWRVELPEGNREFTLKNAPEGSTLPVLYRQGANPMPLTKFMRYANLTERGNLTTPDGLARYSWALPVLGLTSYVLIFVLGVLLL